ncbi:hypothetical protein [Streptomyces zingiberis]|uniref:Uncharacterized protein n=1 Tax=Streptomyces zingiberis TaxID=2053010 RepID=A0ABX1C5N2_9ACTN|nr:hypothetical protein [Streptomyces zingiberis]NJQ03475.1 hypothetical protein [Streptomyces zingiberis]
MKSSRQRVVFASAAATAALAGLLSLAAPLAAAQTSTPLSPASAQGTAPACVARDVVKQAKKVTIRNNCGRTMHVKLVIDWGPDGQCWTYRPGEARTWTWSQGSYGKVVTC